MRRSALAAHGAAPTPWLGVPDGDELAADDDFEGLHRVPGGHNPYAED